MLLTRPTCIANNVPTTASLTVKTKGLLFPWLAHLENKSNVCKHISSLFLQIPVLVKSAKSHLAQSHVARSHVAWSHIVLNPESCCTKFIVMSPELLSHAA